MSLSVDTLVDNIGENVLVRLEEGAQHDQGGLQSEIGFGVLDGELFDAATKDGELHTVSIDTENNHYNVLADDIDDIKLVSEKETPIEVKFIGEDSGLGEVQVWTSIPSYAVDFQPDRDLKKQARQYIESQEPDVDIVRVEEIV